VYLEATFNENEEKFSVYFFHVSVKKFQYRQTAQNKTVITLAITLTFLKIAGKGRKLRVTSVLLNGNL
jgi:hypothetical protein